MNRAPTMVRPAANKYPQYPFRFPFGFCLSQPLTANRYHLVILFHRMTIASP